MKFSHFVELMKVNKPMDEFYLEVSFIFSYSRFYWLTGFVSTINNEFKIIFLNVLFS